MVHNPDDKELKYFQLFWSGGVDNTRWRKVQSDPILIFLITFPDPLIALEIQLANISSEVLSELIAVFNCKVLKEI